MSFVFPKVSKQNFSLCFSLLKNKIKEKVSIEKYFFKKGETRNLENKTCFHKVFFFFFFFVSLQNLFKRCFQKIKTFFRGTRKFQNRNLFFKTFLIIIIIFLSKRSVSQNIFQKTALKNNKIYFVKNYFLHCVKTVFCIV